MSDIYRKSERILVWLGPKRDRLLEVPKTYYDIARDHRQKPSSQHVFNILCNPYFERLWVVQELLLAKHVTFLVGDIWVSLEILQKHVDNEWRSTGLVNPRGELLKMAGSRGCENITLHFAVERFASYMTCSDARDKIYGLSGLLNQRDTRKLRIDFRKSAAEVHLDVCRVLVNRDLRSSREMSSSTFNILQDLAWKMGKDNEEAKILQTILEGLYEDLGSREDCLRIEVALGFDETVENWWYQIQKRTVLFPPLL